MATVFEIFIILHDEKYARQAAQQAFFRLDRLEGELSRFIPNSDISRINLAQTHEIIPLGMDAFNCIKIGADLYTQTNGAFDISIGNLLACWLGREHSLHHPSGQELTWAAAHTGLRHLSIDEDTMAVQVLQSPVYLDLGGMGKGYAVDQMAQMLYEWGIENFLVHGGKSSVLVSGQYGSGHGWPLSLSRPWYPGDAFERFEVTNRTISGSGLSKGRHIINPLSTQPVSGNMAAWAFSSSAAYSDALSTAFMIMSEKEIAAMCQSHDDYKAILLIQEGENERILHFNGCEW
jgi:thiamine biosynthesis lipoprotein